MSTASAAQPTRKPAARARRAGVRAAVAGAVAAGLVAAALPAHAAAIQAGPEWVGAGQEVCVAAAATNHVEASMITNAPGLKFRLIAQSGLVIDHSTSPVTYYDSITGVGYSNWQGAGDYTACAKNNGTGSVYLQFIGITTS
jgi:hypothetical protein